MLNPLQRPHRPQEVVITSDGGEIIEVELGTGAHSPWNVMVDEWPLVSQPGLPLLKPMILNSLSCL